MVVFSKITYPRGCSPFLLLFIFFKIPLRTQGTCNTEMKWFLHKLVSETPVGDLKKVKCVNGVITTWSPVAMSAKCISQTLSCCYSNLSPGLGRTPWEIMKYIIYSLFLGSILINQARIKLLQMGDVFKLEFPGFCLV